MGFYILWNNCLLFYIRSAFFSCSTFVFFHFPWYTFGSKIFCMVFLLGHTQWSPATSYLLDSWGRGWNSALVILPEKLACMIFTRCCFFYIGNSKNCSVWRGFWEDFYCYERRRWFRWWSCCSGQWWLWYLTCNFQFLESISKILLR